MLTEPWTFDKALKLGIDYHSPILVTELSNSVDHLNILAQEASEKMATDQFSAEQCLSILTSEHATMLKVAKSIFRNQERNSLWGLRGFLPRQDEIDDKNRVMQAFSNQRKLLQVLSDETGEKASEYRPSFKEVQEALKLYDPNKPETLALCRPILYLWILGLARYQNTEAPYRDNDEEITRQFYALYHQVPPELATVSDEIDKEQASRPELGDILNGNITVAFFGAGNLRVEEAVAREMNNDTFAYAYPTRLPNYYAFDPFPPDIKPDWLKDYLPFATEDLYKYPKLKSLVNQGFAFGSSFMDILKINKRMLAYLSISHIIKHNGRFSNDQSMMHSYRDELAEHQRDNPQDAEFIFERSWNVPGKPHKPFFVSPYQLEYIMMHEVGFEPEVLSYNDAEQVELELLEHDSKTKNFISEIQRMGSYFLYHLERLNNRIRSTCYQTQDVEGRFYTRWNLPWLKKRNPNPYFSMLTFFLSSSPAFSKKLE